MAAATTLAIKTSHPALLSTGLVTPPLSPNTPIKSKPVPHHAPFVSYAQLRLHHVTALKYTIAKLRWEQSNGGYLRGEDAWLGHNTVIAKLEKELEDAEEAQRGLDRFPNCWAPTANPEAHGPKTKEQLDKEKREEEDREKKINEKLDAQFPFIKQLFIGPRTKGQARNDKMLREMLREGDWEDLPLLLPTENMALLEELEAGGGKKAADKSPKKPYEQVRLEREAEKISHLLKETGVGDAMLAAAKRVPRIGPMTKEEWLATLPKYGPITKNEALLPSQKEQRQAIMAWLRKPWPVYNPEAADLMIQMGRLALKNLDADAKAAQRAKEKGRAKEKEKDEGGKGQ